MAAAARGDCYNCLSSTSDRRWHRSMIFSVKRSIALAAAVVFLAALSGRASENTVDSEARLRQSVTFLASDELEGRGIGTSGLDQAADYIAKQFKQLGLRTDLFDGGPFQEF